MKAAAVTATMPGEEIARAMTDALEHILEYEESSA